MRPVANGVLPSVGDSGNLYSSTKRSGMFPYMYKNSEGTSEGYIDTTLSTSSSDIATLKKQVTAAFSWCKNYK